MRNRIIDEPTSLLPVFLFAIGMAANVSGCGENKPVNAGGGGAKISFTIQEIFPSRHGKWHDGHFLFINNSNQDVEFPVYFGNLLPDGYLQVGYEGYEVQAADGSWRPLEVGYDGIAERYFVKPGQSVRLEVSLGALKYHEVSENAKVRVRIGEHVSSEFSLADVKVASSKP